MVRRKGRKSIREQQWLLLRSVIFQYVSDQYRWSHTADPPTGPLRRSCSKLGAPRKRLCGLPRAVWVILTAAPQHLSSEGSVLCSGTGRVGRRSPSPCSEPQAASLRHPGPAGRDTCFEETAASTGQVSFPKTRSTPPDL